MNLPNKLTLLRMALTPVFVACFYLPTKHWALIALIVFVGAYVTDVIDGQYARKHNIVTDFGKLMDPIADKVLTAASFVMLNSFGLISPIVTIVVVARELAISGFRLVAAGSGIVIAASWLGKTKTVSQFLGALLILIAQYATTCLGIGNWIMVLAQAVIWISVLFTIWSGVDYVVKNSKSVDLSK